MSDAALRAAERRWQATGDAADRGDYITRIRRAGNDVPYGLRVEETELFSCLGLNSQGLAEYQHKTTGMIFVLIPSGEFMMGPTADPDDETAQQQVKRTFDEPFLMAKYPWTGREWYRVTREFPSHFPTTEMVEEGLNVTRMGDAPFGPATRMELKDSDGRRWGEHPVESVSWDRCREVEDFINRLDFARLTNCKFTHSDQTFTLTWREWEQQVNTDIMPLPVQNQALVFSAEVEAAYQAWLWNEKGERVGFQLPSEAMWEYATKAGATTRYPNGDTDEDLKKIAWFGGEFEDGHKAVGLKDPNNWGLHDNCGNVFEWTRCQWVRGVEDLPENGYIANGEQRPDPTSTPFLTTDSLLHIISTAGPIRSPSATSDEQSEGPRTQDSDQPGEPSSDPTQASPSESACNIIDSSSEATPGMSPPGIGSEAPPSGATTLTEEASGQPGEPGFISSDPTEPSGSTHAARSSSANSDAATSEASSTRTVSHTSSSPSVGMSDDPQRDLQDGETSSGSLSDSLMSPSGQLLDRYADYEHMDAYSDLGMGLGPYAEDATPVGSDPSSPGSGSGGSAGSNSPTQASTPAESGAGTSTTDSDSEGPGERGDSGFGSGLGGRSTQSPHSHPKTAAASSMLTSPRTETGRGSSSATRATQSLTPGSSTPPTSQSPPRIDLRSSEERTRASSPDGSEVPETTSETSDSGAPGEQGDLPLSPGSRRRPNESTSSPSETQPTGCESRPKSRTTSGSTPTRSEAETGRGGIGPIPGGSIPNSPTLRPVHGRHGGPDDVPFGLGPSTAQTSQEQKRRPSWSTQGHSHTSSREPSESPPGTPAVESTYDPSWTEPSSRWGSDPAPSEEVTGSPTSMERPSTPGSSEPVNIVAGSGPGQPGERGDSDFLSGSGSSAALPDPSYSDSTSSAPPSTTAPPSEVWTTVASSEDSTGSATPPIQPSEILATMTRLRQELLQERPGGAAAEAPEFQSIVNRYTQKWAPLLEGVDDSFTRALTGMLLENHQRHMDRVVAEGGSDSAFLRFAGPLVRQGLSNPFWPPPLQPLDNRAGMLFYLDNISRRGKSRAARGTYWCCVEPEPGHRNPIVGEHDDVGLRAAWRGR